MIDWDLFHLKMPLANFVLLPRRIAPDMRGPSICSKFDPTLHSSNSGIQPPDRKVDIKDNQLGIKLIPMISTWDQVDPIFPVRHPQRWQTHLWKATFTF
jgi:hypothetical protein